MRLNTVPALFAAALIALPVFSAGAQSATKHKTTKATKASHSTASKASKKNSSKKNSSKKATASGTAGAWRSVYSDSDVTLSMDTVQTKSLADGTYNARLRWQYAADKPIGRHEAYRTLVEHRLVNCTFFGSKPVSAQTYSAEGKPISSFASSTRDLKYMDWAVRRGGTSSSKAYASLCGMLKR